MRLCVPASNAESVVGVLAAVIESCLSIDFLQWWLKVGAFGLEALARFLARLFQYSLGKSKVVTLLSASVIIQSFSPVRVL